MQQRAIRTWLLGIAFLSITIACSKEQDLTEPDQAYLEIPDTQFEELLIGEGIDSDQTINQQITRADAEAVTRLDLSVAGTDGKISNLTGIEGFVNLTFLAAAGHELTEVDLSANTDLDTLILVNNFLSDIDLSDNPNLEYVDLIANELLSVTGLSNAQSLQWLNLSWNYLEELTLDNPSLKVLSATNNQLDSVDLAKATNLENILLQSNELTGIDLRSNARLKTLILSDNQLSEIDLSQNSQLAYLYMSSNVFAQLDVSSIPLPKRFGLCPTFSREYILDSKWFGTPNHFVVGIIKAWWTCGCTTIRI